MVQSDANALTAAVAAERAAATTLNITRRQLELSQVAYLLFINAENSYEQAIISLVQARAPRYGNTAALFQALGGGWVEPPSSPRISAKARMSPPISTCRITAPSARRDSNRF